MTASRTQILGKGEAAAPEREEFFHLNAAYYIDAASKTDDIGVDVLCLHDGLRAVIQAIVDATEDDKQVSGLAFAALYAARQASAAASAYYYRNQAKGRPGGTRQSEVPA